MLKKPFATASEQRFHYIDAARTVLMFLGVVLHTAVIYGHRGEWLVSDPKGHVAFDWLASTIRLFFSPAFFVISGFFVHLMLRKYGVRGYLRRRMVRMSIPLLTVGLTLNPLQRLLLGDGRWPKLFSTEYWFSPICIQHLWFLANSLLYSVAACVLWRLCARWLPQRVESASLSLPRKPAVQEAMLIFALPVTLLVWSAVVKVFPVLYAQLGPFQVATLGLGAAFFALGFILFGLRDAQKRFFKPGLPQLIAWVLAIAALMFLNSAGGAQIRPELRRAADIFFTEMVRLGTVRAVLAIFQRFCRHPAPLFMNLSDASFTVYLTHHILVYIFASLLLPVDVPALVKFPLVACSAAATALAFHRLVLLRLDWLRFLFNGRTNPVRSFHRQMAAVQS